MSDHDKLLTVLMNIDSILEKEKNQKILDVFDEEGKQMALRMFGEGLSPYVNTDKFEKAEKISVIVGIYAKEIEI